MNMKAVLTLVFVVIGFSGVLAQDLHRGHNKSLSGNPFYMNKKHMHILHTSKFPSDSLYPKQIYPLHQRDSGFMIYHSKMPCVIPDSTSFSPIKKPRKDVNYSLIERRVIFDSPRDIYLKKKENH